MKEAYTAARERAAFLDRSARGRIVVSGADRASYLQGLLTNDVAALKPGQGCYAAYLTAQGRMIADLYAYELGDVMLLTVHGDVKDTLLAKFDQFLFSEDVQLGDVSSTFAQAAVIGPDAAAVVSSVLSEIPVGALRALHEHGNIRGKFAGTAAIVTRISDAGEPGFDVYVDVDRRNALIEALNRAGIASLDADTAEAIRIEAGIPLFHRDMDEETIPLEAGIEERAISFTKGCYVGQEVIIRVLHRGHGRVARKLVGMRIDGEKAPASGTVIRSADREIGRVTSAAMSPALNQPIALGYVHRDFVSPGTIISVDGADATVTALPFVSGASVQNQDALAPPRNTRKHETHET
jgi:folate-binding protein YgfZ